MRLARARRRKRSCAVPLRILQVDAERGWRGGQRQTLLLTQELVRRGHTCIIAARAGDALGARGRTAGLRVVDIRPRSEVGLLTAFTLRRLIERERIDVVHAQASHAFGLAALATLGTRARLVVTRHLARAPRSNAGTRWKYARADAVIAVSRAAADALETSGVVRVRIDIVPGGVEARRTIAPAPRALLESLGVAADAPLVIAVGALVPQKDPLSFVRAVAEVRRAMPAVQALWLGDGELRRDVEREIATLGLEHTVHLAGFRDDVDALMCAGSVFVLSSRFEGLPLVVIDAFALGVPVVATAGSGVPELVTDGVTGLLSPVGDVAALAESMRRVLADPALAAQLRRGALLRAPEYSIERTAERTLTVYERVLAR
jgi:glycosyltransferase involved in cell wall biosynthesis